MGCDSAIYDCATNGSDIPTSMLLIMLLTTFDLLARKFADYSIPSLYEFTEDYLMVSLVFLTVSYVYTQGAHVRVPLLEQRLPRRLGRGGGSDELPAGRRRWTHRLGA